MTTLDLKPKHRRISFCKVLTMFVISLIISAQTGVTQAQETGKALKVHLSSGSPQFFMLSTEPVITFEGSDCVITSDNFSTRYSMDAIAYAEIVDHTASIDEEMKATLTVDLSDPNYAVIRGMNPNSATSLVNLAGVVLGRTSADESGTAVISLENLPAGIYII